ncbi:hypothetical protein FS749_008963 [Ceratobasidium sp. UAMH 11750]|nr:hypothetical protein FS749_008963 [Ceratobasidium sp. UAMH 11750]
MKSLVALLDRKKRPNTLVPAPLPSTPSPTASAHQERLAPPLDSRNTLSPDFLQRPASQRATSDPILERRPHLHGSVLYPRTQSPAYHNDPDDDTLADPFAATSPKHALLPTLFRPSSTPAPRDFRPNLATSAPQDAFQNSQPVRNTRHKRNPSLVLRIAGQTTQTGAGSDETISLPAHDIPGKGRWLRERRSLSNLLRPQPAVSVKPVPQLPPFPAIPARKNSFFRRGRSGSTPAATQAAERAHTTYPLPTPPVPVPVQPQMPAAPQLRSASEATRPAPTATPESWARAGGVERDRSLPSSPTNTRRRALSAPARPPRPTEPPPPVPVPQLIPSMSTSSTTASPVSRPEMPGDRQVRPRALQSGPVSVSSLHEPGCAPLGSNLRRRPSLKHFKQSSISTSEGGHGADSASSVARIVRKSALRRTSAQTRHGSHAYQDSRIPVAEGPVAATTSVPQPSTPHQGVSDLLPRTNAIESRRPVSGTTQTAPRANDTSVGGPGRGLVTPSDSRVLPVLDNVWGSFVSETAFGSLPSSPSGSIAAGGRAANLPSPVSRRQTIDCPSSPESPRSWVRRRQRSSALPPPSSPPVVKLPPIPTEYSQAVALSFGSVIRRKLSRCPTKREVLLTPPISPPKETETQALGITSSTPTSGNRLLASSCNSSSVSSLGSRDSPSPASPVSGASDTGHRSWLSVDPPCLRSISPSSTSCSGSQCTLVPGTPIALPITGLANLGASSGVSDSALSIAFGESVRVGTLDESAQNYDLQSSPPSVPMEDSEISLSMFPAVPADIPEPYGRREVHRNVLRGETLPTSWSEESLPTPPITPAWSAQTFDTSSGNERECGEETGFRNKIPLAQMGNLARIRRKHAQNTPSSSSNEGSSDGTWGLAYLHRPGELIGDPKK